MNDMTRITTGRPSVTTQPRKDTASRIDGTQRREARRSPRAKINFIPDSTQLQKLIDDALTALSRGIYWDRGSILDIVL